MPIKGQWYSVCLCVTEQKETKVMCSISKHIHIRTSHWNPPNTLLPSVERNDNESQKNIGTLVPLID